MLCQRGMSVFVYANGEIRKVATCRVKPYELKERKGEESDKWNKWIEEDEEERRKELEKENDEKERMEEAEEAEEDQVMTEDGLKDVVGAKYLRMANSVRFWRLQCFQWRFQ